MVNSCFAKSRSLEDRGGEKEAGRCLWAPNLSFLPKTFNLPQAFTQRLRAILEWEAGEALQAAGISLGTDQPTTRTLSPGKTPEGGGCPAGKAGVGSRVSAKEILELVPLRKLLLTQLLS